MKEHVLKIHPQYFTDVVLGEKQFELRKNDRHYLKDDVLHLREWCPQQEIYTGHECRARITAMVEDFAGLEKGYCVLGIRLMEKRFYAEKAGNKA